MPTNKHRISVPVTESTRRAIEDYAAAAGTSKGAAAARFLDDLAPHIHTIAQAMTTYKANPVKAVRQIQKLAAESQRRLAEEQIEFWDEPPDKGE